MSTATDKYTVDWCRNNPDKAHLLIQHYEKCWGDASQACNDVAQERDALAAHVEALVAWADAYVGTIGLYEEVESARNANTTSLARLKAEWQAEAVETAVARGYRSRDELAGWAEHLRRQSEEAS